MPNNLDHQAFRASEFTGTRRSLDWKDGAHAARHRAPQVNDSGTVTKTLPRTNSVPLWAAEVSISAGLIHD